MPIIRIDKWRATAYLEPELYETAQKYASENYMSISALIRQALMAKLVQEGKLSQESMLKMLAA